MKKRHIAKVSQEYMNEKDMFEYVWRLLGKGCAYNNLHYKEFYLKGYVWRLLGKGYAWKDMLEDYKEKVAHTTIYIMKSFTRNWAWKNQNKDKIQALMINAPKICMYCNHLNANYN